MLLIICIWSLSSMKYHGQFVEHWVCSSEKVREESRREGGGAQIYEG
jgi:hypothetical protein